MVCVCACFTGGSSDLRNIDRVCEGADRTGYIEIHTVDYKCARLSLY